MEILIFARKKKIMADNYLEKQYEKYLEKKAAWEEKKKKGVKSPVSNHRMPDAYKVEDPRRPEREDL